MNAIAEHTVLSRLFNQFTDCLTPEVAARIAALRADAETQALLDELAVKNREGTITPDESEDYDALVTTGNVFAVIQAKARALLAR